MITRWDMHLLGAAARGRIAACWIVPTLRCNARCTLCGCWRQGEGSPELRAEEVARLVADPMLRGAWFVLEGGEVFLHPDVGGLLDALAHRPFVVFSNGLLPDRIIHLAREHRVPWLVLSVDGPPERQRQVRGVESIPRVVRILEALRGRVRLGLNFTFSPGSTLDHLSYVRRLGRRHGARVMVNVAHPLAYLGAPPTLAAGVRVPDHPLVGSRFLRAHGAWQRGEIRPPCRNIEHLTTVYPDGSVGLCKQRAHVSLGNIRDRSFSAIWNAPEARALRHDHRGCNDCWLPCQRPLDYLLWRSPCARAVAG